MSKTETRNAVDLLSELSEKQRDALDLLLHHKTSKEIARDLGISPHTVEQRLRGAKQRLGVSRRSDLATAYRQLLLLCEETVYQESDIEIPALKLSNERETTASLELYSPRQDRSSLSSVNESVEYVHLAPAIFEGRSGTWVRIGAVFAIAAAIIILAIGGMAMFEQLSRLLS